MTFLFKILAIICLIISVTTQAQSLSNLIQLVEKKQPAPLIPRGVFMQKSAFVAVKLSPDGQQLTYLERHQHHQTLWLFDIRTQQHRQLFSNKSIQDTYWANDSQFVFVKNTQGIMGIATHPNAFPRLIKAIEPHKDEYFYAIDNTQPQAFVVSQWDQQSQKHQLVRVRATGEIEVLYRHQDRILDYLLTDSGQLAIIKQRAGTGADLIDVRDASAKTFQHCLFYDMCSLHRLNEQQNKVLLKGRIQQDLTGLFSIDLDILERQSIHQDPDNRFDLGTVYYDKSNKPRLVSYEKEFIQHYALDSKTRQQMALIKQHFKREEHGEKVLRFYPSEDFKRWLVIDKSPHKSYKTYYLYDHNSNVLSQPLATKLAASEQITQQTVESTLAYKTAINYQVSDGMAQFGYLTLPLGKKISQVPLVVVPHGGPWSRSSGGYDPMVQLLANRGFAIFEPNFRASTGMGKHYVMSADQDFGDGRVQQDIIDGLEYVLSQGVGDRDKLAIFGHSFGGFSALTALAFTSNLFKVAIAGAPPTDIAQSVKMLADKKQNDRQQQRQILLKQLAVDPNDSAAMLRLYNQSPDAHWQRITQPLYMLAGGLDDRVSVARVKDFAIRLKQADKPITLLVDEKEGHSPQNQLAREAYAYLVEKALATHLKTDYEATISDNLKRYLQQNIVLDNNAFIL